ncbi:MAG: enoyl-CoA hydratase [Acidobacteriaceae bacterium]
MKHRLAIIRNGPTATLTMCNGRQNVLDFNLLGALDTALFECECDPSVTTVLLRGRENFSAGVDIAAHLPDHVAEMLEKFHGVIRQMAQSKKVLIAEVRGNCLGGGAELAMMCDMVFTTPDARWGFPEIKLACFPPVACAVLAACVGQKRAAELILTGRTFSGTDAVQYGLANATGDASGLALAAVDELRGLSGQVLPIAKRALYSWSAIHWDKALAHAEKLYVEELVKQRDMEEAIRAWMEKT